MTLKITVDDLEADRVLIAFDGAVDAASAGEIKAALEPFITRQGVIVVLDFGALSFIDSAGLEALIDARRRLRELDSELRVTRVPAPVENMLNIITLDEAFTVLRQPGQDFAAFEADAAQVLKDLQALKALLEG